jgi:hypothetical protein
MLELDVIDEDLNVLISLQQKLVSEDSYALNLRTFSSLTLEPIKIK